jgi:uncharacterized membrane protein
MLYPKSMDEQSGRKRSVWLIDQNRVFNFSDGVFAFAATLLVVKIDLPQIARNEFSTNFTNAFNLLWPQYLINIVTFIVIGYYWMNHHAILGHVKLFTTFIVWLNIFFLVSVAFLPFPVDLYGDFPTSRFVVVFYSASLAVVGYLLSIIWWYASSNHRLISENLSDREIRYYTLRNLVAPVIFTLSIPLVYIDPLLTPASWLLVILGVILVNKKFHVKEVSG